MPGGWRPGRAFRSGWVGLAIVVVLTGVVFIATGDPLTFEMPVKTRFNINGGWTCRPSSRRCSLALGVYTASFIAEIVRSGIMAVSHGQTEAARALGLRGGHVLRLVVLPQALRVIIPPLASEYLNITKNTSLARGHRLCRPRRGRQQRAQPDRPVDRGGGDLDGVLPRAVDHHLGRDELVQRAHRADGTIGARR